MSTTVGPVLVVGDERWSEALPSATCPTHGGMLSWRETDRGPVLSCRGRAHYWQPAECEPREVAAAVVLLHSCGMAYVIEQ